MADQLYLYLRTFTYLHSTLVFYVSFAMISCLQKLVFFPYRTLIFNEHRNIYSCAIGEEKFTMIFFPPCMLPEINILGITK